MLDQQWATYVCRYAAFGDQRLKARMMTILDRLAAQPHTPLADALETPQQVAAYYAFLANPRVTPAALLQVAQDDLTAHLTADHLVLAVHDTSAYVYATRPATQGLGPVSQPTADGLHVHSVLALTPEGLPWGLLHQECWARDPATVGTRHQRHQRACADKESARWLRGLAAVHAQVPAAVPVLHIADREADLYPLLAAARPPHSALLIRARHDRRVTTPAGQRTTLRAALAEAPCLGGHYVSVTRRGDQPHRVAKVQVHATTVTLHRPARLTEAEGAATVSLTLVWVQEVDAPVGVTPLDWVLATTLAVSTLAAALRVVTWYSLRWLIERYHYTLKTGLGQEDLQLRSAAALEKALLLYALVAIRLLWLTYAARLLPTAPCTLALRPLEWQTLHIATQTSPVPLTPPTLAEAVEQVARLGGHRAWPSVGAPGVQVLWRGWRKLQTMVAYAHRLKTYQPLLHRTGT